MAFPLVFLPLFFCLPASLTNGLTNNRNYSNRELPRLFRLFHPFFGRGIERRSVDERRAYAESARLHLAAHKLAHLIQLFGRGLLIFQADYVLAARRRADVGGHVGRHAALFEVL